MTPSIKINYADERKSLTLAIAIPLVTLADVKRARDIVLTMRSTVAANFAEFDGLEDIDAMSARLYALKEVLELKEKIATATEELAVWEARLDG